MKITSALRVMIVSLGLGSGAIAQTAINVDINATNGTSGTFVGTGAAPDAGTVFNAVAPAARGAGVSLTFTSGPLQNSSGAATAVTLSLGNFTIYETGPGFDNNIAAQTPALLDDFAYDGASDVGPNPDTKSPANFSINNLTVGGVYDLYVYSQNGGYNNATTSFTIGGTTSTATNNNAAGGLASFVLGQNYQLFSGLVATGGTISGTFVSGEEGNFAAFNGLQLVAVPEPTSIGLLAIGVLSLRRRR